jgi:DNA mismatch repair protein MutS2
MLRVRARLSDVIRKGEREEEEPEQRKIEKKGKIILPDIQQSPGMEFDMRGMRVDEGLDALELYLERAYLVRLPFVRIIHGKGTGRLRESIRQALGMNPHIDRYESGGRTEGGDGVTVAHLKSD